MIQKNYSQFEVNSLEDDWDSIVGRLEQDVRNLRDITSQFTGTSPRTESL